MDGRRYTQAFLGIVIAYLVVFRPLLDPIRGFGKIIAVVVFAALLMFVVTRSTDMCRMVAEGLRTFSIFIFAVLPDQESVWQPITEIIDPAKPSLPSRFQRPPPPVAA